MAELTPNEILADGKCFACEPLPVLSILQTVLLAKWLVQLDPGADVTPSALLADGKCFACLTTSTLIEIQTILLNKILANGGGGGSGGSNDSEGSGDPSAPPSDPTKVGFYRNTDGEGRAVWAWSPGDSSWHQTN